MKATVPALIIASICSSSVFAQASKPPLITPDISQASIQRARAQVMTVQPTARTRTDAEIVRAAGNKNGECSMTIAPLPDKHDGESKLGTVNQIVVVENTPILVCGR